MKHSQLYRERNKIICELVKQGKVQEVFDRFGLCDRWINEILKESGISDRIKHEASYVLDIQYH